MAQAGYTPIQLYFSTTAAAVPLAANLAQGELAINIADGKLYYENSSGVVTLLAGAGGAGIVAGSNTQLQFNNSGVFGASSSLTWDGTTLSSTQVNITGQGTLRLQDTTGGEYVGLRSPSALGASYTLTFPADDGTSGQALITDGSGVLSWSTAASGDVYGPGSSTDNAVARFDSTTGKLLQNSVVIIGDTGDVSGVGTLSATTLTLTNALGTASGGTGLGGATPFTSGGVVYASSTSALATGSNLTYNGTALTTTTTSGIPLVVTGTGSVGARIIGGTGAGLGSYLSFQAQGANAALVGTEASIFGSGTSNNLVLYGYSTNSIIMAPSTAEVARFTSTGLGIGNTNPQSKLHILSAVGTAETLITLQSGYASPSGNKSIAWTDGSGRLGAIGVNYTAPQGAMTFGSLYNSGYNTTDLMTLTPVGLGIGINPTQKLDVYRGSSGVVLNLDSVNQYSAETGIAMSSGRAKISGFLESGGGTPGSILRFYTMPNEGSITQRMEIGSNGYVGIAKTAPGYQLTVNGATGIGVGTSGNAGMSLTFSGAIGGDSISEAAVISATYTSYGTNSAGALIFTTNSGSGLSEKARISAAGNLSINSTVERTKLFVASSNANDAITVGSVSGGFSVTNSNTTYGLQIGSFSTGNSWLQSMRMDGTATTYNLLLQPSGGNVGIGTSSPAVTLDVAGNIRLPQNTYLQAHDGSGGWTELIKSDGSNNTFINNNKTGVIIFNASNVSERARIDSSGNFLVGTTTTKDVLTVSNGISMIGGGAGSTENYSGTDTRTWASSYVASGGTQTLCRIASPNGAYTGGGLVRVTTSYQYRGGNPGNNYAQYMITTNAGAAANLIYSAGTYPTITVTTVGSGATATLDVIVNYVGDSHVQVVVEVFGKVVSWSI